MALKTFCFSLWMLFILFTLVKGNCLQYGHSCWGGHGKRSGSNKIYRTDIKPPIQMDFQDLTDLQEKKMYDSTEEQIRGSSDLFSPAQDLMKDNVDEFIEKPDKNSSKLKKFLYKNLNKTNEKQRNMEFPEHQATKSNSLLRNSERWRRLPLYNLRNVQNTRPDNEWFKELQQERQINEDDYI